MKRQTASGDTSEIFLKIRQDFERWTPFLQRLGLKARRYWCDREAVYFETADGCLRLSLQPYEREELRWLREILAYLEERSFNNWAVSWRKTMIWEDGAFCYLLQPWRSNYEIFPTTDPAALSRAAEILAEFHRAGKDYQNKLGLVTKRERWNLEEQWLMRQKEIEKIDENYYHEKLQKGIVELKKTALNSLAESLEQWRNSGLDSLQQHQSESGLLSHGDYSAKNLVWHENNYYLLNWEYLAFQPRVLDLATFINDQGYWEAEWLLYFLEEYLKIQPLWLEEQQALLALLRFPHEIIKTLNAAGESDFERKQFKEVSKELAKKEHCLNKVASELGSQKRWMAGKHITPALQSSGHLAMTLSPIEFWDQQAGVGESLIQAFTEQRLPADVLERLNYCETDRVMCGGRTANVLEAAAEVIEDDLEIDEQPPQIPPDQLEKMANLEQEQVAIQVSELPTVEFTADLDDHQVNLESEVFESLPNTEIAKTPDLINSTTTPITAYKWKSFPETESKVRKRR